MTPKIESGTLSLSNICQAQSFFRDLKKVQPEMALSKEQKIEVLAQMEDKSTREGQKVILSICPPTVLPRERERMVSAEHTEVRFLIDQQLRESLDQVRALLGPKGADLSLSELVAEMARLSAERLSEKRFGKARMRVEREARATNPGAGAGDCLVDQSTAPDLRKRTFSSCVAHATSAEGSNPSELILRSRDDHRSWQGRVNCALFVQDCLLPRQSD
ncbi:MAG: hypothetical protein JST16_19150 [Bdellovibrionales bacterium]|nr:hypothetical protein [Bdellovibrionales bacterium]